MHTQSVKRLVARAGRRRRSPERPGYELVYVALLDGKHLWLGVEHSVGMPRPAARLWGADLEPTALGAATSPERTAIGWRVPLDGWLEDTSAPDNAYDEFDVEVRHNNLALSVSRSLDRCTAGGAAPRRTPDGRWLLSWSATGSGVRVRRRPAPPHASVTGFAVESGELVVSCTWTDADVRALLVVGDNEVVGSFGTTVSATTLTVRLPANTPLAPGRQARLMLDTAAGRVPLARRHHGLDRPGDAVVLPALVDRSGRLGALALRYDREGELLVQRAHPARESR